MKTNPKNAIRKGKFSFLFLLGSGRKPDFCEVEEETFSELLDARADGIAINYRWIRQTAQSIIRKKILQMKYRNSQHIGFFLFSKL